MHTTTTQSKSPPDSSVLAGVRNMSRQVMSSREIADLTGKRHDHVMRDIRRMLEELQITDPRFGGSYRDGSGRSLPCFFLDRDLTETLITGYSIPLRHRVIVRLRELEDHFSEAPRVPTTLPEALRLAADQAEENQKLHMVIQQQAPKVEALERLANTQGSLCITDAAKHIGIQPLQVFAWMSKNRWIYRRSSFANWSAFQPRISSGLLEHKLVKVKNNESEELKIVEQVMVTRRGLVVLAEKINGASL
ncbi:phage regulatory protein/antirepressor Ant [Pseudomonas abietaniphila]|uniref:Phage antirepressor protein YoqD, KilAC domain n=1 Tax=Pseudomonas abietaniphila TaxID=89065 RepID=A0A1G8LL78_9PSED|nr:phage regulatory protein/antirepressor Ant [Pseudomonas abietaniphila]SDI56375.1 Phage antirepressor protein YoqD, KilAC domain [Pseudomonas abietaniphila]